EVSLVLRLVPGGLLGPSGRSPRILRSGGSQRVLQPRCVLEPGPRLSQDREPFARLRHHRAGASAQPPPRGARRGVAQAGDQAQAGLQALRPRSSGEPVPRPVAPQPGAVRLHLEETDLRYWTVTVEEALPPAVETTVTLPGLEVGPAVRRYTEAEGTYVIAP